MWFSTEGERSLWEHKYCRWVVEHFLNSDHDYVIPFREPVDEVADDAPGYYDIILHPMDLKKILRLVESRTLCFYCTEVRGLFKRMFSNCYEYNEPDCEVYRLAETFERAFDEVWAKRDDWMEAERYGSRATIQTFEGDKTNGGSENILHRTSGNDAMKNTNGHAGDGPKDNATSGEDVSSTARPDVLPGDDSNEDNPSKTPEHQSNARKEDDSEELIDTNNTANTLNHNGKRPLDATSTTEKPLPTYLRSILERLRPILSDTVTAEIATLTTLTTTNAQGEFNQYIYIWHLLRCNEQEAEFEKIWKANAMDKVCRIPITLAVGEQVRLALAETVVQQKERFKEELDRDAAAFANLVSGGNGGSNDA